MPAQPLKFAARLLEMATRGAEDADIERAFASLRSRDANFAGLPEFREQLTALGRRLRDNALAESGLNFLIDTTQDLASTLGLQDLLRTIVVRARALAGADVAWLTVLDHGEGLFRVATADGHLSSDTAAMTSRMDRGAVSLVMNSKTFFETADYLSDRRFPHARNLDRIFVTEKIKSLAGFPILWQGHVHGLLFVANRRPRRLNGRETSLLGTFALHAGAALRNANAFAMLSQTLEDAQRHRDALSEHIQRMEAAAAAHDELADLLASGAGIRQFLERLSNRMGAAVLLYDDDFEIADEFVSPVYSGALADDLRGGRFDNALLIGANAQSRRTGRSIAPLEREGESCRAIALHGAAERRDTLVICRTGEFDAIEVRNFERSAVALSIAKLWNERREAERQVASSTLLRGLVQGSPPEPAVLSALRERLALRADQPVQLAVLTFANSDPAARTAWVLERVADAHVLAGSIDETFLVAGAAPDLQALLQALSKGRRTDAIGGIVSEPFADLSLAPTQFRRVKGALRALCKMKPLDRFVNQREVNIFAKLFESDDSGRIAAYAGEVLGQIAAKAPRQSGELRRTLLVYFDAQHNIRRTADVLGLHVNTVRQRLDALRQITGGWDDPVAALELHVALRLDAILS